MRTKAILPCVLACFVCAILCCGTVFGQASKYQQFFPPTQDAELKSLFEDPAVEWYTVDERPPVFQHDFMSPPNCQFFSIYRDIGPGGDRYSNGNGEWPWAHPATRNDDGLVRNVIGAKIAGVQTHRAEFPQFEIVRVLSQPPRSYVERKASSYGLGWSFGPGTEFVELLTNRIDGADYTFKVHRMTMQPNNEWRFRVYRPFTDRDEYERATKTTAVNLGVRRLTSIHDMPAFVRDAEVWKVPAIDSSTAIDLLEATPFKLCTNDDFIPTTDHPNQIYPKHYLGPWIGNAANQENCRSCHQQVAVNVRKFASGEWYGQIRGGGKDKHQAGVFSWYPR